MKKYIIGLISGTSKDGVDAAVVDYSTNQMVYGLTYPYNATLKKRLDEPNLSLKDVCELNVLIGREFATAALKLLESAKIAPSSIKAIGSHGQTICHDTLNPIPYTLQLGCPHTIAEVTGIQVVADFRARDLAAGGQGAPLAPVIHQVLFDKYLNNPIAVINIGGIANLTYLHNQEVIGFDTGPGNCLLDDWIRFHHDKDYDEDGNWAQSGKVIYPLLSALLQDSYFSKSFPKSIGKEYFSVDWLNQFILAHYLPEDVQATLVRLTATTIVDAIRNQPQKPYKILICGGGVHNKFLLDSINEYLKDNVATSTQSVGVNPDFIEAQLFAWLAEKTLTNTAVDLKNITGSTHPVILGAIYPAGIDK